MTSRILWVVAVAWALGAWAEPGPLGLSEAIGIALQHQPLMLEAMANTGVADGRFEQARGVLLPQVTGTASYNRVRGRVAGSATVSTFDQLTAGLTASQTLWDFAAIERLRASSRAGEAQRAVERATGLQVVLGARRAFLDARTQHSLEQVASETLENQLKHQIQIEGFVKAGIRPDVDLAQAKTDVANARVQAVTAHNNYRLARARLQQAIGLTGPLREVADDEVAGFDAETTPRDALVDEALNNRPELASLIHQREAQELTIGAALGGYLPTVSAVAGVSETAAPSAVLNWNVGVVLNWPLFQGGITTGQLHEAQRTAELLTAEETAERLQVRLDVESAQLSLESGQALISAATDALDNARARLQLAEGRYTAGIGSAIELGDAQTAAANAAAQLIQARFTLSTARAQLLAALGRSP